MSKAAIPKALRNAVWIKNCGPVFHYKCQVSWCQNVMTPFDFEAGHNIPESKGGATTLDNLRAICSQCNKSMGNRYTIDEFSATFSPIVGEKNVDKKVENVDKKVENVDKKEKNVDKKVENVEKKDKKGNFKKKIFNCFSG